MVDYKEQIKNHLEQDTDFEKIVRMFYLVHPTCAFSEDYEKADEILNEVSDFFKIPINDIVVCGSAKLGFSLVKQTIFEKGRSDLDLAILNRDCYFSIFDEVLKSTMNYSKRNMFSGNNYDKYTSAVSKGMINYKFLPRIERRTKLLTFFDMISIKYRNYFSTITCCFYASEFAFKQKQINGLNKFKNDILEY